MLIALFAILLLIFVALLLGGSARTTYGRAHPRPERSVATSRQESSGRRVGREVFAPRRAETATRALGDFFQAGTRKRVTAAPDQSFFSSTARVPEPTFTGRGNINWDALHRLTGQPHRTCECGECQELRSRNGLN